MKEHKYKVTLEYLEDNEGNPQNKEPLTFEVTNHDDIFKIVELAQNPKVSFAKDGAPLFVGLKLFADVCMKNREDPLFASIKPHLVEIIKTLKPELKK